MLKIGVAIAVPLIVVFIAFPQFRTTIAGLAPLALFALCPLAMLFGVKGMTRKNMSGQRGCSSCEHDRQRKPAAQKAENAKVIQHAE